MMGYSPIFRPTGNYAYRRTCLEMRGEAPIAGGGECLSLNQRLGAGSSSTVRGLRRTHHTRSHMSLSTVNFPSKLCAFACEPRPSVYLLAPPCQRGQQGLDQDRQSERPPGATSRGRQTEAARTLLAAINSLPVSSCLKAPPPPGDITKECPTRVTSKRTQRNRRRRPCRSTRPI